jgi:hypothetical protein
MMMKRQQELEDRAHPRKDLEDQAKETRMSVVFRGQGFQDP